MMNVLNHVTECSKKDSLERLCEKISNHNFFRAIFNINLSIIYAVGDKIVSDMYMPRTLTA